jgi:hypothetical protein
MKTLWILAAAATFAACHNRSSDETGAAPDRGDSTMTTVDTTTPAPNPSASGYDTTAAPSVPSQDTTAAPSAPESGIDTTSAGVPPAAAPTDTTMPSADTTSTSVPAPTPEPSTGIDTTDQGMTHDSTMGAPTSTDSTQK